MAGAALLFCCLVTAGPAAAERRCGWLDNPTPGNWWLVDRDHVWTIATQGRQDEAVGMERIPDLGAGGLVRTNGNHGYGCACLEGRFDRSSRRVLRIDAAAALPLARCRSDRALPPPPG